MNRVTHFEIAVDDAQRAIEFYRAVFGWKIEKWAGPMDYWLITTGKEGEPGINGALQRRAETPQPTINIVDIASIDETLEKIVKSGGEIFQPKIAVPGVGWAAYCKDSEGNIFGLMEEDPSAK